MILKVAELDSRVRLDVQSIIFGLEGAMPILGHFWVIIGLGDCGKI